MNHGVSTATAANFGPLLLTQTSDIVDVQRPDRIQSTTISVSLLARRIVRTTL
jgi:hypothetical protein